MPRLAACLMVMCLAGCSLFDAPQPAGPETVQGWRFASGKAPSRAEYAAVAAACREGAVRRAQGQPFEACLANLGLKRE